MSSTALVVYDAVSEPVAPWGWFVMRLVFSAAFLAMAFAMKDYLSRFMFVLLAFGNAAWGAFEVYGVLAERARLEADIGANRLQEVEGLFLGDATSNSFVVGDQRFSMDRSRSDRTFSRDWPWIDANLRRRCVRVRYNDRREAVWLAILQNADTHCD